MNMESLRELPRNTFGREYSEFMLRHGLSIEERPVVTCIGDYQLAYIFQRYKEIHDFLHVLLGLGISEKDEIVLKWFEMAQLGLPSCTMAALLGGLRLGPVELLSMSAVDIPHVMNLAESSSFVMNIPFEEHFSTDLESFRQLVFSRSI